METIDKSGILLRNIREIYWIIIIGLKTLQSYGFLKVSKTSKSYFISFIFLQWPIRILEL